MEVGKSLDGVEGAILLIDSARGVQAQTLSVYDKAKSIGRQRRMLRIMRSNNHEAKSMTGEKEKEVVEEMSKFEVEKVSLHGDSGDNRNEVVVREGSNTGDIRILPALTKVDMPSARPLEVALAVSDLLGFDPGKNASGTGLPILQMPAFFLLYETTHAPPPTPTQMRY